MGCASVARYFKDFEPALGDVIADLCAKFGFKDDAFDLREIRDFRFGEVLPQGMNSLDVAIQK